MELIIAIILGLAASEITNKGRSSKPDEEKEQERFSSGYDPYRNVYWTLEQKWTTKEN